MQTDYIVKTQGHYGYKIFRDYDEALRFCNSQDKQAIIFQVDTREVYRNEGKN